jgi:hypothetical protein
VGLVGIVDDMAGGRCGYAVTMGIINRIVDAILTIITAPFRAVAALFGRRGGGRQV